MPPLILLGLVASGLCVSAGLAMSALALVQGPRSWQNRLAAAYFLAAAYSGGAAFLARVFALVGSDVSVYFYESYDGWSYAFLALLALVAQSAGLLRRRRMVVLLAATTAVIALVQVPLMHGDRLIEFRGYGSEGDLELALTPLSWAFLLFVSSLSLLLLLLAAEHRATRALVPGVALAMIGPLVHLLVPASRPYPLTASSMTLSTLCVGWAVLRQKPRGELQGFAISLAHDLKGQLGPILGASQILDEMGDDLDEETKRDYRRMIMRNAASMADMIDSRLLRPRRRRD